MYRDGTKGVEIFSLPGMDRSIIEANRSCKIRNSRTKSTFTSIQMPNSNEACAHLPDRNRHICSTLPILPNPDQPDTELNSSYPELPQTPPLHAQVHTRRTAASHHQYRSPLPQLSFAARMGPESGQMDSSTT